ncbi:MAG: glycosyl transferase family 2 [Candidatus Nealsonbacteria bacterium CG09_land_8_20_14_0_10_42_14]|uniref:Glycosyl transferase family 2 n=1 Tax=Candidatus Nealsonbacteria bacterium CG09_land_8_20_14_0_10_42_14 TaxID=1974707 RepID=A0A2H0WY23_9BACT|nr:MAG: glycosyl transferase family 2 [Candidatus Nealsonbacteria bacterium CG09_land_8_20_14_0_10_42_14]
MLSIVIPTLNEEKYLPLLLESIKRQSFKDYEIVVSDAGSKDKTREIAEKYGCLVVAGGFPAAGKNRGAEACRGELILFVDADVILKNNSLGGFLKEFEKRNLAVATFLLNSNEKFHNFSFKILYNFPSLLTERFLPQAMNIILVKKDIHQKIGGFNEKIKIGEELDYIRRGRKFGKFGVLKSAKILASPRRFKRDGWLKTWLKYFLCQVHMIFLGPVRSDLFKYRFNHYNE